MMHIWIRLVLCTMFTIYGTDCLTAPVMIGISWQKESNLAQQASNIYRMLYPKTECFGKNRISFYEVPNFSQYPTKEIVLAVGKLIKDMMTVFIHGQDSHFLTMVVNSKIPTSLKHPKYVAFKPMFSTTTKNIVDAVWSMANSRFANVAAEPVVVLDTSRIDRFDGIIQTLLGVLNNRMYYERYEDENSVKGILDRIEKRSSNSTVFVVTNAEHAELLLREAHNRLLLSYDRRWILVFTRSIYGNISKEVGHLGENILSIDFSNSFKDMSRQATSTTELLLVDVMHLVHMQLLYLLCNQTVKTHVSLSSGNFHVDNLNITRQSWRLNAFSGLNADSHKEPIGYYISETKVRYPDRVNETQSMDHLIRQFRKTGVKMLAALDTPYVTREPNANKYGLGGLVFDILNEIFTPLEIPMNITIHFNESMVFGGDLGNGTFDGIIGAIQRSEYEMAMAAIIETRSRLKAVQFSQNFDTAKSAIILRRHDTNFMRNFFKFYLALDMWVWIAVGGSVLVVGTILGVMQFFSPNRENYNLYNSIFVSMGSLLQGVTRTPPNRPSGRLLISVWWFFCLMFSIAFVCNYTALLIKDQRASSIKRYSDLLEQDRYEYGAVKSAYIYTSFSAGATGNQKALYHRMANVEIDHLVSNTAEGVQRARNGDYAFFENYQVLQYFAARYCELSVVAPFGQRFMAFASSKESFVNRVVNQRLGELRKSGKLDEIKYKYFGDLKGKCIDQPFLVTMRNYLVSAGLPRWANSIGLIQTGGIQLIMLGGCIVSLLIAVLECIVRTSFKRRDNYRCKQQRIKMEKFIELSQRIETEA